MSPRMNYELEHILFLVKQSGCTKVAEVQTIVENYFRPISWSLLKEEYEVLMSEKQRQAFLKKVLKDVSRGDDGNESWKRNKVD